MSGLEFAWRLIGVLVWPVVVLLLLIVYRSWITSTFSEMTFKAGPFEVQWKSKLDSAARNVAGVLAETSTLPSDDDPIPTNLVDLFPLAAASPSRGVSAAFHQVRRALDHVYPQLEPVASERLPDAMRDLVRQRAMDRQIEWAITELYQLFEMSNSNPDRVNPAFASQFLSLAEGTIHALLRSATRPVAADRTATRGRPAGAPISSRWEGEYNGSYRIELLIDQWNGERFQGVMGYPDSGATTDVTGRIEAINNSTPTRAAVARAAGAPEASSEIAIVWRETGYRRTGGRSIDFDGEYRATVLGKAMTGVWYQGERRVAGFQMNATEDS